MEREVRLGCLSSTMITWVEIENEVNLIKDCEIGDRFKSFIGFDDLMSCEAIIRVRHIKTMRKPKNNKNV